MLITYRSLLLLMIYLLTNLLNTIFRCITNAQVDLGGNHPHH